MDMKEFERLYEEALRPILGDCFRMIQDHEHFVTFILDGEREDFLFTHYGTNHVRLYWCNECFIFDEQRNELVSSDAYGEIVFEGNIDVQGGWPDLPICARSLLSRAEIGAGLAVLVAVEPDVVVLRDLEHEAVGGFRLALTVAAADVQRGAVFAFAAGHLFVLLSNGLPVSSHSHYSTFGPKMQGSSEKFSEKITARRFLPPDAGGCRTSAEAGQAGP